MLYSCADIVVVPDDTGIVIPIISPKILQSGTMDAIAQGGLQSLEDRIEAFD
ncbi:MAG: hypothetical protein M3H12_16905 [Chromatiales bacterium]|nr:hypothetical protein [Gammaproteobacteria bacterium]